MVEVREEIVVVGGGGRSNLKRKGAISEGSRVY